ncbi:hypothetical protein SISNIDRAFT_460849 [Sistotremastrum niveocremeum HHB9708]|uniref:Uncharacterized protein n=1 Tax=Sistotremastrum niveocremeum HHB9708 TaxID=1314777 RepID=A0A164N8E4_9AGAM|nr:hypothetical protein SISNIDRAFT_460849 [Sistotremastrum niveocremeum HHB9708]
MSEKIFDTGKPLGEILIREKRRTNSGRRAFLVVLGLFIILATCYCLSAPCNANKEVPRDLQYEMKQALQKPGDQFWWDCRPNVECGRVVVPTDYNDPSVGIIVLAVARWKARNSPRKGTVFTNPGGPGISGTKLASGWVASFVGNDYDIIGFDPRGVGETTPTVQCHTPRSKLLFEANTVLQNGFSLPQFNSSRLYSPSTREYFKKQMEEFLALKKVEAELCAKNMGEALRYMGTTYVARDIEFMNQLFHGDDEPINFWSASYGSILGAYLVNMFPDRVGKVVIDGIVNPIRWTSDPTHLWARESLSSIEDTFEWFLSACARAGPAGCALAKPLERSSHAIGNRIDTFLDHLYDHPMSSLSVVRPGVLTSGAVRALFVIWFQNPFGWPSFAHDLAQAMYHNNSTPLYTKLAVNPMPWYTDLSRSAITCADSPPLSSIDPRTNPTVDDLVDEGMATISKVSLHFGVSSTISEPDGGCQFWKYVGGGVERYSGPWNKTLSNKILIVSNTADPVTPIASAKLLHNLLKNSSSLLVQNSPGHTSMSFPSLCTIMLVRAYFDNGTLPAEGTICEPDSKLFPRPGIDEQFRDALSEEERLLLRSAEELGKIFTKQYM